MTLRLVAGLLAMAALCGCAATETREFATSSWQNDPLSQWVVDNDLAITAQNNCPGGWTVLSKSSGPEDGRHVTRWTVSCSR